jgi:hypothetical protein
MAYLIFQETTSAENGDGCYCGETWAEAAGEGVGYIKWHADEHAVTIDYVETAGRTPLLGVRLLKALWDRERKSIDPGLMNEAGSRLWWFFKARYFYC